jgi:phage anti-repressor protein
MEWVPTQRNRSLHKYLELPTENSSRWDFDQNCFQNLSLSQSSDPIAVTERVAKTTFFQELGYHKGLELLKMEGS